MTGAFIVPLALAGLVWLGQGDWRRTGPPVPAVVLVRQGEAVTVSDRAPGEDAIATVPAPYVLDLQPWERVRVLTGEQAAWVTRWFPGREAQFARIVTCESMWDDSAIGAAGERGRLQLMAIHAIRFGYSASDLADPEVSGYIGARLLEERPDGSAWTGNRGCSAWNVQGGEGQ